VEERLSYCRLCVASCGMVVTVEEDDRVAKVRGDSEHPLSHGYLCPKGRGLASWHHSPARLSRPRLRGVEVSWDELLDDLGGSLAQAVSDGGPSSIGMYQATGMGFDAAGAALSAQLMRSLRSRSFYTAVTLDNAPVLTAIELITGNARLNPMWSPKRPGLLLLVAHNPVVSHGYGNAMPDPVRHLRDFRGRGGRIWVADPRRTETAALADEYLPVRPGADVVLLAAVARELLRHGCDEDELSAHCRPDDVGTLRRALDRFTVELASRVADVPAERILDLVEDLRIHRGRVNIFAGTGAIMGLDGVLVEWLRWVLLIITGSLDTPGGMQFSHGLGPPLRPDPPDGRHHPGPESRPELPHVMRQMPVVALVDEIEAGNVQALLLCGGDPIAAAPDPDRTVAALASLDTLAVIDVIDNELCELATHVLPATGLLERADVSMWPTMTMDSTVQYTPAVVAPVGGRRPTWWILAQLARRLDVDLLPGRDPDTLCDDDVLRHLLAKASLPFDELLEHGPRGLSLSAEVGWLRRDFLRDGCWNLAPPQLVTRLEGHSPPNGDLMLTTRRETGWINSVRYQGLGAVPVVRMNPGDLARFDLDDGGRAWVRSEHGSVEATVLADGNIRPGVVSMTHGHRGSSPGSLISRRVDVDPLTTMPRASALPVTVSRSG
jgi:anaerobic selenocysteine-containing dehydrogenase